MRTLELVFADCGIVLVFWLALAALGISGAPLVLAVAVTAEPACYEFNCADNRPCRTQEGCLGWPESCYCDVETNQCRPR